MENNIPSINGLVLCGGRSTRMGIDKGEINYHNNKGQRRRLYEIMLPFCEAVFISCNLQQSTQIDLPKIEDAYTDIGPVGGILSAFETDKSVAWLTLACDLPFLDIETIAYLAEHRNHQKTATAFWSDDGKFPEPLITIWEPKAYPVLLKNFTQGCFSPSKILIDADVEILDAPNALALKNVNTANEYAAALKIIRKK